MYRIAFVMEQALGHVTHTKNLQRNVPRDPEVKAHWLLIPFEAIGLAAKVPLYRSNWTVRAGWRARRALAGLARQTPLDGLFIHTQVPAVLAADWVRRYPTVISLDATPLQYDQLGEFYRHARGPEWLERLKFRLNQNVFHAAAHLVVWADWTKKSLVADYGIAPEKISVIPPGVNLRQWARPEPRTHHDGPVRILFVGGDLARKGGHLLLESFRALRSRRGEGSGVDASLPLQGKEPEVDAPLPLEGKGPGVGVELHLVTKTPVAPEPGLYVYNDIAPNDPRLVKLYHQADIFALPTFGDCLPMVLSEAGAAGLPVVSTRVAGIPEIVADGESGFLVPPHDGQALTEALARLVDDADLRLRMGRRAVAIIAERFDAEKNADRLLALIKATVDRVRAMTP
jgi:glycosyltransferase involved in cell wall biosynthesis